MHSSNSTQHGRQPPPQQAAPPTDPRTRNLPPTSTAEDLGICRDFIWGICGMGLQCKYRHELEFDAMKAVLKFCHDHQNRTGCTRPDCTYLHTSREEENLFLTTGQIPRILIERYAGMSSNPMPAPIPVTSTPENGQSGPPHNMMYEYIAQPPPPPPPPQPSGSNGMASPMQGPIQGSIQGPMQCSMQNAMQGPMQTTMQGSIQGPRQGPMQGPIQGPMQSAMQGSIQGPMQAPMQGPIQSPMQGPMQGTLQATMQGPMPGPIQGPMQGPIPTLLPPIPAPMPPPPPPPPPTTTVSSLRVAAPVYTPVMPPSQPNMAPHYHPVISQPNALPAMFDPSRPPPPFAQPSTSRGIRRPLENDSEAGPSKLRKTETSNDSSCENCVQRLIRIELYNQQLEQLHQENEQARTDIANKMDDYERKKQLLKNFLNPELFRCAEDYVENGSPFPFTQWNETYFPNYFPSPMSATANANNNMTNHIFDMLLSNNSRGLMDLMPSSAPDDGAALLQQRATRARPNNSSTDVLSTLFDLLRNVPSAAERSTTSDSRSSEPDLNRPSTSGLASSSNGFNRFLSENSSPPGPSASRYLTGRPYGDSLAGVGGVRSFGDVSAAPSNVPCGARAYGDSAAGPAPLALNARAFADGAAATSVVRPYLENTHSHPYADNVVAGPSNAHPYADGIAGGSRYPPGQAAPPRQYHPSQGEGATVPPSAPATAAPPMYMPAYSSPTQPPNPRSFYGHFPSNNMPNPPYPGVAMTQAPRPPMPLQNAQNNPYFMGNRYPNQQFYPPYQ